MSRQENTQGEGNDVTACDKIERYERHEISVPGIGNFHAYIQGYRSYSEVVILTVHDLGCDHTMYEDFIDHPQMCKIKDRTVWVHVVLPGQQQDAADLPPEYTFPTMQMLGDSLVSVLDQLKVKEAVCFGEGAGANILARFAMAHTDRVHGVCLLHCTGTAAGFLESLKDKVINYKLDHLGMNPSSEAYLILHRFGTAKMEFNKATSKDALKQTIENYQSMLRTKTSAKNLKKFVEAFLKRSTITDNIKRLKCPVLLITGQKSVFNGTTHALHQALVKVCADKGKVEFIEVKGVANVLEEKPEKLTECFQYFLQGLGLVSSVPMHHIARPAMRMRSMSMEEYDKPLRQRSMSGGETSPPASSPPKADVVPATN